MSALLVAEHYDSGDHVLEQKNADFESNVHLDSSLHAVVGVDGHGNAPCERDQEEALNDARNDHEYEDNSSITRSLTSRRLLSVLLVGVLVLVLSLILVLVLILVLSLSRI